MIMKIAAKTRKPAKKNDAIGHQVSAEEAGRADQQDGDEHHEGRGRPMTGRR